METVIHTYRDRASWPCGPWDGEPDHVEWCDPATGFPCIAHRNAMGAWCGYVGVDPTHPWHGVDYMQCPPECCDEDYCGHSPVACAEVHGGITHADRCQDGPAGEVVCHTPAPGESDDVWWFGWDSNHAFDRAPGMVSFGGDRYRDLDYVTRECARLARQLADVNDSAPGLVR